MQKILIVGSSGLVGKNFFNMLNKKYRIDNIDKHNVNKAKEIISNNHYDFLIYLALSKEYKSNVYTQDILFVNVELLRMVLEQSIGRVKNVIYFSTGSVYRKSKSKLNSDSILDYNSSNPYVLSKIMGEMLMQSFEKFYESCIIVRPFYIYGPGQNKNMLFNFLIDKISNNENIIIGKDGGLVFNPIHVFDVVHFLDKIIMEPISNKKIYNFCGGEVLTLKELILKIGLKMNYLPIIVEDDRQTEFLVSNKESFLTNSVSIDTGINTILNEN
jgi:nucleoside-diphosphate-sugar epimerase